MASTHLSSSQSSPPGSVKSIYDCVRTNDLEQLRIWVLTEPRLVSIPEDSGLTPLMLAANLAGTRLEAAQMLIEDGAADPNQRSTVMNDTAVHYAATHGDSKLLYLLLKYGGNPLAKNKHNKTPIDLCKAAVPQTPMHPTCVQFMEYCAANGAEATFGFSKESFGGRIGTTLESDSSCKSVDFQRAKHYLSPLPDLRIVHESAVDVVIQGPLQYAFKGGNYTTPIVCYVSKCAVPELYDEPCQINVAADEYREAIYRCRIDLSSIGDLMINPKARYVDPLSGVILVSIEDTNACNSATEFLFTVVGQLFSMTPPLCKKKTPIAAPVASASATSNVAVQYSTTKVYDRRVRHTTSGILENEATNVPHSSKAISAPPPSAVGYDAKHIFRQMALSCSTFFSGSALCYKPKLNAIIGVIPFYFDMESKQGGAKAPAPKSLNSSGYNNNGSQHSTATRGVVHVGRTESIDESSTRLDDSALNHLLAANTGLGSKYRNTFDECNYAIPVRIQLPDRIDDVLSHAPRAFILFPHVPQAFNAVSDYANAASRSIRILASNKHIINPADGEITCATLANWEALVKNDGLNVFTDLFTELQNIFGNSPPIRGRPKGKDGAMSALLQHIAASTMAPNARPNEEDQKRLVSKVLGPAPSDKMDLSVCEMCGKEPRGVRLYPCEHLLFCTKCFPNYQKCARGKECPLCRSTIAAVSEVCIATK